MNGEIQQPSLDNAYLQYHDSVNPKAAWNHDITSNDTHCSVDIRAEDTAIWDFADGNTKKKL